MTNAEKYLKDRISVEEFATMLHRSMASDEESSFSYKGAIKNFLNKNAMPTLTEDERMILESIYKLTDTPEYNYIARNDWGGIELLTIINNSCDSYYRLEPFDHLFKFIKNGEKYEIEELLGDEK